MSSTNKTPNLHLNSWIGSDKPKMDDFNYDNSILDSVISSHRDDESVHITYEERSKWNKPSFSSSYYGNGSPTRTIVTGCPFEVAYAIIFADSRPPVMNDYSGNKCRHYFGIATPSGSTLGLGITSDGLRVTQSAAAETGNNYACFNETGVAYRYVLFRMPDA
ncbi:MAG: hypothetical protein IJ851_06320 [Eubacterium sp.]|nr:hypothetical protein [Eubacterium sp.]